MAYFKINNTDYSAYVNELEVDSKANYAAQTNAAGNTVVDYINTKRTIKVGIIPVDSAAMMELQEAIASFNVSITFLNPKTNALEENLPCIIPDNSVEYYTIQANKVSFNAFKLNFIEL